MVRCKTPLQGQISRASAVNWTTKDIITANSLSVSVVVWCFYTVFLGRGGPGSAVAEKATELQRQKAPCRMHNTSTSFVLLFGRAQNEGRLAGSICQAQNHWSLSLSHSVCLLKYQIPLLRGRSPWWQRLATHACGCCSVGARRSCALLWQLEHEQPAVAAEFASTAYSVTLCENVPGATAAWIHNRLQPEHALGIRAN